MENWGLDQLLSESHLTLESPRGSLKNKEKQKLDFGIVFLVSFKAKLAALSLNELATLIPEDF